MNNQFSENLKKIRKEHNLSQEQLADELGVSRQAISKWESAAAYPEMDKIIFLCEKFNLNIDDLLHKDIKEVKGEEESKKKINNIIETFLKFITDSVNMFANMNLKSKIKCLFEQAVIIFILFIASLIITSIVNSLSSNIINFLPTSVELFLKSILYSLTTAICIVASIIIIIHIFKIRYLDYYSQATQENNHSTSEMKSNESESKTKKKQEVKSESRIIIRDPKHSEYKFINGLCKLIMILIKIFLLGFAFCLAGTLIALFGMFVLSFLIAKTGVFFIGVLGTILSSALFTIIILLLILNFVFNRKNDKKKAIWSMIISVIVFGIGCGFLFIGTLNFKILEKDESMQTIEVTEHDMTEDLLIHPNNDSMIEYVATDNENIKIEYTINELCTVVEHKNENSIMAWGEYNDPIKVIRKFISNVNNKKIIPITSGIQRITVYTNQENIEKLKNNWNKFIEEREQENNRVSYYEETINELEEENEKLRQKISDIEEVNNIE